MPVTEDGDHMDEDETNDDTTDDTTNDDSNSITGWGDLSLPTWATNLSSVSDRLVAIAKNPQAFVLGALLSALIAGILDLASFFVDAVMLVLIGSSPGYAPSHEYWGLEDIPLILWNVVSSPFASVGDSLLGVIGSVQSTAETLAMELGLFAYPAAVAFIVITIIAVERTVSTVSQVTLSAIPVVGPALEVLLYR